MSSPFSRSAVLVWPVFLLLLVLAVWLRWDVYPKTYFADELIPLHVVKYMQDSHTLDTNWDHADWRGDYAGGFYDLQQYNFSSYHTALYGLRQLAALLNYSVENPLVFYRQASCFFQLLTLAGIFLLLKKHVGAFSALVASVFFVVMPQAVIDAHYARPESFVMLLVTLAVGLSLRGYSGKAYVSIFLEAAVWGVAFACKFSFFPMVLLACAVRLFWLRQWWVPVLWCAGFVAGIALSAPYILLDIAGFFHGIGLLLNQYAPAVSDSGWLMRTFPSAHQLFPYLLVFFGAPALLVPLLAFLHKQHSLRFFSVTAILVSVFYVALFSWQGVFFERNLSHLLPLWAALFALGFLVILGSVSCRFTSALVRRGLMSVVMLVSLVWPLYLSVAIVHGFFRGSVEVKENVAHYERDLQVSFSVSSVMSLSVMAGMQQLNTVADNAILRVPQHKIAVWKEASDRGLREAGFHQVGYLDLPLSFLPYNQLQINHFPPAYAYYLRDKKLRDKNTSMEMAR